MSEMTQALRMLSRPMSTGIQKVDYPIHKGKPNDVHGKFYFVGSVPVECHEVYYDTEAAAIDAALKAGVTHLQGADCRVIVWGGKAVSR